MYHENKTRDGLGYDVPHKDTYKLFKTKLERQGIEVQEFYQQPWWHLICTDHLIYLKILSY